MKNSKKFLPTIIIFLFVLIDIQNPYSKNIIVGLYVLFPILFIVQGLVINNKKDLYTGVLVSAIAVVIIAVFYNMGTTIVPAIIYSGFSLIVFFLKNSIKKFKGVV